jgi:hypothetical protein
MEKATEKATEAIEEAMEEAMEEWEEATRTGQDTRPIPILNMQLRLQATLKDRRTALQTNGTSAEAD